MKAMFHGSVPENHDARLAYDYYYLLGDWDSRNAVGVAPLKEMVDVVDGIKSLKDMTGYLVNTPGEDRLYRFWTPEARQNPEEPCSSMLSLKRSAFFLLDRAEYREMTDEVKYQIEVFTAFFQKMLAKLGYSEEEARQKIDNCFAWETMMNSVDPDEGKSDDSEFTNDIDRLYTRDELKALTPNVPLLETLEKAEGYPAMDKYFIPDSVYFERLNELYTEEYPDNWDLYSFEDVDFASKEDGGTLWDAYRAIIKHEYKKEVAYYNAMHPWEGQDFDGDNMKGEACCQKIDRILALRALNEKIRLRPDFFCSSCVCARADALNSPPESYVLPHESYTQGLY